jgi:hypothetical protein
MKLIIDSLLVAVRGSSSELEHQHLGYLHNKQISVIDLIKIAETKY